MVRNLENFKGVRGSCLFCPFPSVGGSGLRRGEGGVYRINGLFSICWIEMGINEKNVLVGVENLIYPGSH